MCLPASKLALVETFCPDSVQMDSEMKWRHVFAHQLPSSKALALTGQNIYIQFICTEKTNSTLLI
jgi:hypothetical protein